MALMSKTRKCKKCRRKTKAVKIIALTVPFAGQVQGQQVHAAMTFRYWNCICGHTNLIAIALPSELAHET